MWVLLSDASSPYTDAANALQAEWRSQGRSKELVILQGRELSTNTPPAALVTLGSSALRNCLSHIEAHPDWLRTPVLAALLPREGFVTACKSCPPWVSAAYLDQPFERYLDLIKRALPRMTKVGVLLGPEALGQRTVLAKAAVERGMQLVIGAVPRPDAMYASLRAVLAEADVLLVLPDSAVADANGLQNLLITAYRHRVPVVTYSPALVKSGATLGLYASPSQIGKQVAGMLKGLPSAANWPAPRWAEGYTVTINAQVARSLGLDLPEASELSEAMHRQDGGK